MYSYYARTAGSPTAGLAESRWPAASTNTSQGKARPAWFERSIHSSCWPTRSLAVDLLLLAIHAEWPCSEQASKVNKTGQNWIGSAGNRLNGPARFGRKPSESVRLGS
jgi:hypothetical protein